ncbi:DUF6090 family protein [Muriicola sp. E247]|uniref:DUF6090 family protein n=1 Tax=Muriicola sp. E247 TaxID=3242730 RepID=UPI0035241F5A
MINFFRKIRKQLADDNQFFKYSRYAIGEILLVVIGILIALQINNWNERRKTVNKEKGYIRSIYKDLQKDLNRINISSEMLTRQYNYGIEVLRALEQKESKAMDSVDITNKAGWELTLIIPMVREKNTWDDLKVKGIETYIIKDSLTQLLNGFYANYDTQINRFNQLPKKVREELRLLTAYCNDSEGVQIIFEKGIDYYGASSPRFRECILSNMDVPGLVSAVTLSAVVNIGLCEGLRKEIEAVKAYMEEHFKHLI